MARSHETYAQSLAQTQARARGRLSGAPPWLGAAAERGQGALTTSRALGAPPGRAAARGSSAAMMGRTRRTLPDHWQAARGASSLLTT